MSCGYKWLRVNGFNSREGPLETLIARIEKLVNTVDVDEPTMALDSIRSNGKMPQEKSAKACGKCEKGKDL